MALHVGGALQALSATRSFPSEHGDFVHHVAYDYYGKRIATCSSDQTIKARHVVPTLHVLLMTVRVRDVAGVGSEWERRVGLSDHVRKGMFYFSAVASRLFAPPHVRHAGASRPSVESRLVAPGVWPGEWPLTWLVALSVPFFSCSMLRGGHVNLQILASCSFDQNCYIWEEHGESGVLACVSKLCLLLTLCHTRTEGVGTNTGVRWQKTAQLCDARESVNDCKFAPRHMGLKLVRHGCARMSIARAWTSLSILCTGDCFGRRLRSYL